MYYDIYYRYITEDSSLERHYKYNLPAEQLLSFLNDIFHAPNGRCYITSLILQEGLYDN